jgi:predicted RNA-binding protein (TIGR00451 family)
MEEAVNHLPKIWALDSAIDTMCHGADLKVPGVSKVQSEIQKDEQVAIFSLKNELVALGTAQMISKDIIREEKGVAVRVEKVFMEPGVYKISTQSQS